MNVLLCFGTRPEWLKIKPLTKVLDNYELLFTGQHTDLLDKVKTDHVIDLKDFGNRLDSIIINCLNQFPSGKFDSVLVQGDTASAFACALAAFHRGMKIYYLEAGLRTYNLNHPYPEEGYRQMISRLSDVNFCPTQLSMDNLLHELVRGDSHVVGNTVLDNLNSYKDKCEYQNKVLVTLHRRENHIIIDKWFREINKLAKDNLNLEFIFPLHPNPKVQKYKHLLTHVNILDSLPHPMLLDILCKCKLVITDSGGLQEEGSFLNKKVIVCRKTTERPEGKKSGHIYLCKKPEQLNEMFTDLIKSFSVKAKCPYGDGDSSIKISDIINENF